MESFFVFWIKCSAVSQFSILPQRNQENIQFGINLWLLIKGETNSYYKWKRNVLYSRILKISNNSRLGREKIKQRWIPKHVFLTLFVP